MVTWLGDAGDGIETFHHAARAGCTGPADPRCAGGQSAAGTVANKVECEDDPETV